MRLNYLLLLLILILGACGSETEVDVNTSANKIMPVGDSRVDGLPPLFESYRYELWKLLIDEGVEFDLVGPFDEEYEYPDYAGNSFDGDHAGVGGFETEDVLNRIDDMLLAEPMPDIVLLGIGGNDFLSGDGLDEVIANINLIIDEFQAANGEVLIILEQIAPGRSDIMTQQLTDLFDDYKAAIASVAENQTTSSSIVIAVDMSVGWSDDYMADTVHYNRTGAEIVAQRYLEVLREYLVNAL